MKFPSVHYRCSLVFALLFLSVLNASAQTTAFNYQGQLSAGGNPATGSFQLQFKLFDAATGGSQIGATLADIPVTASAGVFSTRLDFGSTPFTGADRFLEIAVRRNAGESYTTLAPRQQITSSPYSIRTLSAAQADVALDSQKLGGVDASEYVKTSSVGATFVKNATDQQANANFNIDGNGVIGGALGVGAAPLSGNKLDVSGSVRIASGGNGGVIQFGSPSFETGMTISGTNRADYRFDGSTVKILAGMGTGPPPSTNGINIDIMGNVGVGTSAPQARFNVSGGSSWFQGDTTPLPSAAGKGIVVGFSGENGYIASFDYGTFTPKNLLLNNPGGNVGIGTTAPRATLDVAGNVVQDRDKGGITKAMLYVSGNGTLQRCYNGVTGDSAGSCGFTVTHSGSGLYEVDFGFQVSDRFISATTSSSAIINNLNTNAQVGFDFRRPNTTLKVRTFATNEVQTYSDSDFFLIVY